MGNTTEKETLHYYAVKERKYVLVIEGIYKGRKGWLMGRWDSDPQNWTVKLDSCPNEWVHIRRCEWK